ncbi:MAG TPA: GlsB/YeaQ/YmgE family stress response membrane protein [Anaerolineales bacterium]
MTLDAIITWIIVGGIAGLLAEWLVGGVAAGCIGTVVIGILGAFVGGWLFGVLGISIGTGLVNNIITAFVGAAVLLIVIRLIRRI